MHRSISSSDTARALNDNKKLKINVVSVNRKLMIREATFFK